MIGLEYIVKLYDGTYKKLAEKLGITPSTVTDWISKRRPIPKAKLEALAKLFKLEEELFQKELSKIEEIELRINYIERKSKRDWFEIDDIHIDVDGKEYEYKRKIDPYEAEWQLAREELRIEKEILLLQSELYNELYREGNCSTSYMIVSRLTNILMECNQQGDDEQQIEEQENKNTARLDAIHSMMYWMGEKGSVLFDDEKEDFHNELHGLLKKYDLLWDENQ